MCARLAQMTATLRRNSILCRTRYRHHRYLHSFPTRRSSDLGSNRTVIAVTRAHTKAEPPPRTPQARRHRPSTEGSSGEDRKSTRLNSSHGYISYAVFCLKKKNTIISRLFYLRYISIVPPTQF